MEVYLSQIKDTTSINLYSNIGKRNTYYSRSVSAHKIEWDITENLKFSWRRINHFW